MRVLRVLVLLAVPWLAIAQPPFSPELQADAKVIYVDFWASWCGPCRRSFPWPNHMQAKYGAKGFTVIGVNVDPSREDAQLFLDKYPATFPPADDPGGELATRYALQGMPSSILLGADGEELSRHIGFSEKHKDDYEQEIVRLLEAKQ